MINTCETLSILGDVGAASFVPWIEKHARKLGLNQTISHRDNDRIDLILEGPPELIDAMEMGCSLGPIDVWVETIQRQSGAGLAAIESR
jgi:acylphosphatase